MSITNKNGVDWDSLLFVAVVIVAIVCYTAYKIAGLFA